MNPVSGPVAVKGAKPGDVLAVEILELRPGDWGWTAIIPGFGLLADEYPDPWLRISRSTPRRAGCGSPRASRSRSSRSRARSGWRLPEPGEHSIVPPSTWGGNLDIKHLRAGTTLYLPVGVDGALFSVGDTHAAMGDGEVCGTAVEAAMDIVVRLSVRRDFSVPAPAVLRAGGRARPHRGRTRSTSRTGVGPDLFEATRAATRAMIGHLGHRYGLDRQEAYALCSVACDLRVHEVVDQPNWVVGMFLPEGILAGRA